MNIGQLRRSQVNSYSTSLPYRQDLLVSENSVLDFYNQCMYLSGGGIVTSLYSYYLKFEVRHLPGSVQDFTIKLQNDSVNVSDVQEIRTYSIKQGINTSTFEIIFNPNSSYNQIVFDLKRLTIDFYTDNGDGTSGRIMDIKILNFSRVTNIISDYLSKNYSGLKDLKKVGIQGPPGLLLCINGEEIRVGKSGIYELYDEDILISYIGFIVNDALFTQNGKDFFIMDFGY